jgi:Neisseria PilC beta-propeller domain
VAAFEEKIMSTTSITRRPIRGAGLLLAALASLAFPCLAQIQTEGYDPLRQMTAQLMKANLLILQDITGSMAWYPDTDSPTPKKGDNSRGQLFWNATGNAYSVFQGHTFGSVVVPSVWSAGVSGSTTPTGSCTSNCRFWYYLLTYEGPARLATVKNALGNSIDLVTAYTPPPQSQFKTNTSPVGNWRSPVAPATVTIASVPQNLAITTTSYIQAWLYTFDYGTTSGKNNAGSAPGTPFDPFDLSTNFPLISGGTCSVGTCKYVPPQDLVGNNQSRINWGLTAFSTNSGYPSTLVHIDTTEANKDLAKLEDYLYFSGSLRPGGTGTIVGLASGGSTNTIAGFGTASTEINLAANNDPKVALKCNRPYGVVLVTDGLSNSGNPNGDWLNPCGAGPTQCDSGGGTDDCPSDWAKYAAQQADNLYKSTTASNGFKIPVRTWTIGVSTAVGPCELDYIAYHGRTDANSPKKDTGWSGYDAVNNPYIPDPTKTENADPRINYTIANTQYDGPAGQYYWNRDTTIVRGTSTPTYATILAAGKTFDLMIGPGKSHGHNAFFATTATQFADAMTQIVNATAAGDYSTSAPLSGAGAKASNVVTLASTDFPKWQGHFYAYDSAITKATYDADNTKCYKWLTSCYGGVPTDNSKNSCIPCMTWDAGYLLTEPIRAATSRKIYTWNPLSGNALVEVTAANLATLQAIAASLVPSVALTAAHVDFIRGNDGTVTNTFRSWRLGPLMNSTPALIAAPLDYTQNTVSTLHGQFRIDQGTRIPVLWVGSNDGMLHGFRLSDGYEQVALLPPSLLGNQSLLYDNYKNKGGTATGQIPDTTTQVYGVANSLRFSDIYFPKAGSVPATFKTVGFLSLGPGAEELTAIDLTHPSPGDYGYGFGDSTNNPPVQILWRKTNGPLGANTLPGLFESWSVPALAPVTVDTYRLVVGGGFNKANTAAAQKAGGLPFVNPVYYILNPTDGTLLATQNSSFTNSPAPLVGNQAFADSVLLRTAAKFYQEDNLADLGLQADLNGRIWFASGGTGFPTNTLGIDVTGMVITNQQPIYYPPAASGYGDATACDVFAFASGTLYERSASVTGPNVGTGIGSPLPFEPSLYVAASTKPSTAGSPPSVPAGHIARVKINSLVAPACPVSPPPGTPPCVVDPNAGHNLSNASQVTAPPFLLVPRSGTGMSKAFFLVYDPKDSCNGFSYIVELDVTNNASCTPAVTTVVYGGGVGAASGFTISADKVRVAQSGIGTGATATISTVPNVTSTSGGTISLVPQWWRELK